MRRRRLLGLATGALAGLAGCQTAVSGPSSTLSPDRSATDTVAGVELPVPTGQLHHSVNRDAIAAITDPVFGDDWSGLEFGVRSPYTGNTTIRPRLGPDDRVIGVERDGEARAYPLKVLNWHEVVNDALGGPLLVTYCPLCRSGVVAERTVAGEATTFGVSGLLWRSNLVLYDGLTDSLWSQLSATAIRGRLTGTTLEIEPSNLTTWGEWRSTHPDTVVLRPPPESDTVLDTPAVRDYRVDPYGGYEATRKTGNGSTFDDDRLHPKALVIGVTNTGSAKAYPLSAVAQAGVVNDRVGERPVVVAVAPGDTLVAYDRRLAGEPLRFERADDRHLRADGSRFAVATGAAVDGPHAGETLESAADHPPLFWFSWLDFHPDSALYRWG